MSLQLPSCTRASSLTGSVSRRVSLGQRRPFITVALRTYDDALTKLNTLQTPHAILKQRWDTNQKPDGFAAMQEMRQHLAYLNITQSDLARLNVAHVAGTKGKGSTCAFIDSILRLYKKDNGYPLGNVGLFTSPHLVAVRERIRINSVPIARHTFAKYFFEVWDMLEAAQHKENPIKPLYFRFLTLMSFHVFLKENVDAAIYEVGIGGEYDSTNIIDYPCVTGISKLGIDHTFILGDTIEEIAWNKAGIMKEGVSCFTVPQPPEAMAVIAKRSMEKENIHLETVDFTVDELADCNIKVKPNKLWQKENAALAVDMAATMLKKLDPHFNAGTGSGLAFYDPKSMFVALQFKEALENTVWRGRCEILEEERVSWYLDGAHTKESIQIAAEWYDEQTLDAPGVRILVFNQQGHRDTNSLLETLYDAIQARPTDNGHFHGANDESNMLKFDHVIFCPTIPYTSLSAESGVTNDTGTSTSPLIVNQNHVNLSTSTGDVETLSVQIAFKQRWKDLDRERLRISTGESLEDREQSFKLEAQADYMGSRIMVHRSLENAIDCIRESLVGEREHGNARARVLVTGSIHLVGRALGILEGEDQE